MIPQLPVNVVAPVVPSRLAELESALEAVARDPSDNDVLPFGRLEAVHFGRLVLLPAALGRHGSVDPPILVLALNVDGDPAVQLRRLVRLAGEGLDRLFASCRGYPLPDARAEESRFDFLLQHSVGVNALYVNTAGRTLEQVGRERRLCEAIRDFVDREPDAWPARSASEARTAIRDFVASQPDLRWALDPPPPDDERHRRWLRLGAAGAAALVGIALLIALPWLLVLLVLFALALRAHEIANVADNHRPANERIRRLERNEDHEVQNQLSAVGLVQNSPLRRVLVIVALAGLGFAARNVFYRGQLSGVDTIHFARWVVFDRGRRLYFFSNYDGSAGAYQDDFVERVAFGLNLVFSNGAGWPRSRWLVKGGAEDEEAFKAFYRERQVPSQAWYVAPAYRGLNAVNVARNAELRAGLPGELHGRALDRWLRRI